MQAAPGDEGPVRAVPQAPEQHGGHERGIGAPRTVTIAAERNVEVIAQPRGQCDMPAAPEVREPHRRVGEAEVVRHGKSQAQRRADRGGRIAGEVAEDLTAERQRRRPGVECPRDLVAVVDTLRGAREETVGEHDLVEEAEGHERQPEAQLLPGGAARLRELRHQLRRAHDRTGHQVRKEGHEQRVIEQVLCRRRAPQVHVQGVRHGRERIEGDAHRQDDVVVGRVIGDADRRDEGGEVIEQELSVLEIPQHAEVRDHRQQHPGVAAGGPFCFHEALRGIPVDHGRHPQQDHERRIPRRVEQVTRHS